MQERVVVVGIVRQHALVGVDFALDVVIERIESDFVFISLLETRVQIWEPEDPFQTAQKK